MTIKRSEIVQIKTVSARSINALILIPLVMGQKLIISRP